ncbi:MAG: hypothetical protein ACRDG8_00465 [Actinomycetota bacterium]
MRGWAKVLLWAVILLACAGAGAFIAYLFPPDPFPPEVGDPGARPSLTPGPSPEEVTVRLLSMSSRSSHTYRVGGSCTSDWRLGARIELTASGRVSGRGVARLVRARCDFPSAQVQARRVVLRIVGRRDDGGLDLRFRDTMLLPVGSRDLGGFVKTMETLRFTIAERAGAKTSERRRIEEPEDEIYASVTTLRLRD